MSKLPSPSSKKGAPYVNCSGQQKVQRLSVIRELYRAADVALVFLLVINAELFVDRGDKIADLDRVVPNKHALFIRGPQTRPPVIPAPAITSEKTFGQ